MISTHAEEATTAIIDTLSLKSPELHKAVRKIIEQAIVDAVRETTQECRDAATMCCANDSAMTKQIREEIRRAETALIANLSGMR